MARALALAERGLPGASPNPLVGCVIIKDGRVVGEGWHERFGGPHAEVIALKRAGRKARGATLYVNLEPCSHWGKTPPCAGAVIQAGVKRVVIGSLDPNPLVAGRGRTQLINSGIRVTAGVLRGPAHRLNRAFFKFIGTRKPYVILKSAVSLDGKIASASGQSKWITSGAARKLSRKMRTQVDAILVGAETVRKDNPSLTSHGAGRNPIRVVVSQSGRLPRGAKIFNGEAPTLVLHANRSQPSGPKWNALWIRVPSGRNGFRFKKIVSILGDRGISKLLIEGGGRTSARALEEGLVDEAWFFIAPKIIGGETAPTAVEGKGFASPGNAPHLKNVKVRNLGRGELLVQGQL